SCSALWPTRTPTSSMSRPACGPYGEGMSDPDQPGEEFDEAVGDEDYPPDRFQDGDDLDRTEPEVWERGPFGDDDAAVELVGDDAGVPDEESELVGESATDRAHDPGPLADDDEFTGDETTRDVASEHVPRPAEDAAVHIDEDT